MSSQPYPPDPRAPEYQQIVNQAPSNGPQYVEADNSVRTSSGDGVSAQSQRESYVDPMGNQVENREDVFVDRNLQRTNQRDRVARITYYILAVLEVLLALRFFFRLLGASQGSGFVMFLYNLTHVFVGPFSGIFNDQALDRSVFEFSTLVAMVVYALIAWGIVSLSRVIYASNYSGRQSTTTTRRRRI